MLILFLALLFSFFLIGNLKKIYHEDYIKEVIKESQLQKVNSNEYLNLYKDLMVTLPYFKRNRKFEKNETHKKLGDKVVLFSWLYCVSFLIFLLYLVFDLS